MPPPIRAFTLLLLQLAPLSATDAVTPGRFVIERPTLICLGFEWQIAGDDNRNAAVEVSYRKKGDPGWKQALPLFRLGAKRATAQISGSTTRRRRCSPAASSTSSRTPNTRRGSRCAIPMACADRQFT